MKGRIEHVLFSLQYQKFSYSCCSLREYTVISGPKDEEISQLHLEQGALKGFIPLSLCKTTMVSPCCEHVCYIRSWLHGV